MSRTVAVAGVSLELEERGDGPPLLFLHAGEGLEPQRDWLDLLARRFRVIAPHHPGWGNSSLPDWMMTVDDLAYLYLDLAGALEAVAFVRGKHVFHGETAVAESDHDLLGFGTIHTRVVSALHDEQWRLYLGGGVQRRALLHPGFAGGSRGIGHSLIHDFTAGFPIGGDRIE